MIGDDDIHKPLPRQHEHLRSPSSRAAFFSRLTHGFAGVDPGFDDHSVFIAEVTKTRHLVPVEGVPAASGDSYQHFYRENSIIFKPYEEMLVIEEERKHAKQARMQAEWEEYLRRRQQEKQAESDRLWNKSVVRTRITFG